MISLFSKIKDLLKGEGGAVGSLRPHADGLSLAGPWTTLTLADQLPHLRQQLDDPDSPIPKERPLAVNGAAVTALDTGAALTLKLMGLTLTNLAPRQQAVWALVTATPPLPPRAPRAKGPGLWREFIEATGRQTYYVRAEAIKLLSFIGETAAAVLRCLIDPARLRWPSVARHVRETGINALPIISLMAFLISIVLAYQGAAQLKKFGAELFTVNMLAISLLREMGVLLTAIMVAGRSGSAFTAEIGVMKVNEEVDAMRVIGLDPFETLVVPRFVALLIALPLLTLVADVMGALGGAIVSYFLLDIQLMQYVQQFQASIKATTFWVGMSKAPVFALLISVVGCLRGMEVSGSAESVGRLTTVSVVHSIFLVLLADALFSILFTKMGI